MSFDPDKYLEEKGIASEDVESSAEFNPDSYLEKKGIPLPSEEEESSGDIKSTPLATGSTHFAQGLSFGLSDEIAGGVEALGDVLGYENVGTDLSKIQPKEDERPWTSKERLLEAYRRGRDTERSNIQQSSEERPKLALGADLLGSVVAPIPAIGAIGKVGKAGSALAKVGGEVAEQGIRQATKRGMATGAKAGALEGYGRTDSEDAMDQLFNAGTGGALGGLLGKASDVIGAKNSKKALEAVVEEAPLTANKEALKAMGANANDFAQELGTKTSSRATAKTAKGTGKTVLDEGVLKGRQTVEELKESLVKKLDDTYNKEMVPTVNKLDEASSAIPIEKIKEPLENYTGNMRRSMEKMVGNSNYAEEGSGVIYNNMLKTSENVYNDVVNALKSPNKFNELNKIKQKLQSEVNWKNPTSSTYNEFLISTQADVSKLMNDLAQKVSPELGETMVKNNKTYANLLRANDITAGELTKAMAKGDKIGLGEYVAAGVISGVTDNKLLGPASIAAKRMAEKYGGKDLSRLMATHSAFRADKAGKSAKKILENMDDTPFRRAFMDSFSGKSPSVAQAASNSASALLSDTDATEPYKRDRQAAQYVQNASPEQLIKQADDIKQKYGKSGERLADTLAKIAEKDKTGRNALIFSLLQSPDNRKMLGLISEEK